MGVTISSLFESLSSLAFWSKNQDVRILMLGLDSAGKTTILYRLQVGARGFPFYLHFIYADQKCSLWSGHCGNRLGRLFLQYRVRNDDFLDVRSGTSESRTFRVDRC